MEQLLELVTSLEARGISLAQWVLAWARVLPTMLLVPAFGARFLPPAGRAILGLSLGLVLAPALAPLAPERFFALAFLVELLHGLPVALSAATLMWAAMMAGGLMDDLRGHSQPGAGPFSEVGTPLGTLLGLFAAVGFLKLGGATRLAAALVEPAGQPSVLSVVGSLVGAIDVALALSAPVLVAVIVWEVAGALLARSASPAHIQALLAPLRSLAVLGALAISADALFQLLSRLMARDL